ncbi:cell division protein ZapC [Corallincola luteus]|uniref:Cell division protein ZapC n=1 Tax=Corallincola luteus TaxID=1775177 RepID=A0ABY2AKW5_9GAMM|nr:cell division protein ZapC domain-containing protein [Corallincola luteus]TCI03163.1 cell division protein ZapC [Corallincola luteus]
MLMQPRQGWRWYFDESADRLCVALDDDMHFKTHFRRKQLCPVALQSQPFSTDDAKEYHQILEVLLAYKLLPQPLLVQCALNAVAAKRFLLPMMPKSWFFTPGAAQLNVHNDLLVELQCLSGAVGQFLVLETTEQACLCMLLDDSIALSDSKSMQMFDCIKVMNDRVVGYVSTSQSFTGSQIA